MQMGNVIYSKVTYRTHSYGFSPGHDILASVNMDILCTCIMASLRNLRDLDHESGTSVGKALQIAESDSLF
jgi:hypothetical protein